MNKLIKSKWFKWVITFIVIALFVVVYRKVEIIRETLSVILISFIIAYSLKPLKNKILERVRINPRFLSALLILFTIGLIVGSFALLIPSLMKESIDVEGIINSISGFILSVMKKIKSINNETLDIIIVHMQEKVNVWLINLSSSFFDMIVRLWENAISMAVIPVVSYYFLADGEKLLNKSLLILPTEKRTVIKIISKDIDNVLGRYIFSQIILSLIVIIFTFIGLMVLKVKFPLWLSLINGIANIIPYFGPLLGWIPALFIALISSPTKAIETAFLYMFIQQIEGDIISPKITGDSVNMHPLGIILLLLIGEKIGGIVGMVLAIPIGVIVKVIYEDINYYIF